MFAILINFDVEYANTIEKVKTASGFPMALMIYYVCPAAFIVGGLLKTLYHTCAEPWKEIGGTEKWTGQQFVPKPRSEIVNKEISIPEADVPDTPTGQYKKILKAVHEQNS